MSSRVRGLIRRSGFDVVRHRPEPPAEVTTKYPLDFDESDIELCRRVAPYTMTSLARIYALARAVEYVGKNDIRGAFVECGVWRGGA